MDIVNAYDTEHVNLISEMSRVLRDNIATATMVVNSGATTSKIVTKARNAINRNLNRLAKLEETFNLGQ